MSPRSIACWLALLAVAGPAAGQGQGQGQSQGQANTADQPAACDAHYVPPRKPQRLTRTLIRDLADGKQIITSRTYLIHFSRQGHGWRIDGQQVDVQVDSPPKLAALAALERERKDRETLPIMLDQAGHIVPGPARAAPVAAPQNTKAVDDMLAAGHMTPAQRATVTAVSHAMLAPGAAVATPWPEDVFDAVPGTRQEVTHPSLPDGTQGDVAITITAAHPDCGRAPQPLSRRMERDVVTRLGGTTRHTKEIWTLGPAAAAP